MNTNNFSKSKESKSISELIEETRVDLSKTITLPPIAIKVFGERFGTFGNFSVITGKAKARKTYLVSSIVASYLSKQDKEDYISCHFPDKKSKILYFDTEQSELDTQNVGKRIMRMASSDDKEGRIEFYALRSISTPNRVDVIDEVIFNTDNVGLVIIDGIRDLIYNINDPEESTVILDKILEWTGIKNVHLIIVLHQNKVGEDLRGHIGTEVLNKSETIVTVAKQSNKDFSIASVKESRGKEFKPFSFFIDQNDHPVITEIPIETSKPGRKKIDPENYDMDFHETVIADIFKTNKEYISKDFKEAIIDSCENLNEHFTDSVARRFLEYYKTSGFVKDAKKGNAIVIKKNNKKKWKPIVENTKSKKQPIKKI